MALKLPLGLLKRINRGGLIAFVFSSLFFLGVIAVAQPQPVQLLLENHPTANGGGSNFVELDGLGYYLAYKNGSNTLFKTDGTTGGTEEVIFDNPTGSAGNVNGLLPFGSKLLVFNYYFSPTDDHSIYTEPAIFDPMDQSLTILKDINLVNNQGSNSYPICEFNEQALFLANDGVNGNELWITDGTEGGTSLLKDTNEGASGITNFFHMQVGSDLFIIIDTKEVWKTDGTAAGTILVKDFTGIGSIQFDAGEAISLNGKLYFRVFNATSGKATLWETNGTEPGTVQSTEEEFSSFHIRSIDSDLFIIGNWYTSGFNYSGILKENPLSDAAEMIWSIDNDYVAQVMPTISGIIYFSLDDDLWKTDGTLSGTELVKTVDGNIRGTIGGYEMPNGEIIFFASDVEHGYEIWKTDGTEGGTAVLKDIYPGIVSSYPLFPITYNDEIFFTASDGKHGTELWKTNGTESGTTLLFDANTRLENILIESTAVTSEGVFFTSGINSQGKPNLYKVNSEDFLEQLSLENGAPVLAEFSNFVSYNDSPFIFLKGFGLEGNTYLGLATYTESGLNIVKHINLGISLRNVGDKLLFPATSLIGNGRELWVSDGTTEGTYEVTDIAPGRDDALDTDDDDFHIEKFNEKYFFSANDQSNGYELWVSDLTVEGTTLIKDINPGANSSKPRDFKIFDSKLLFLGENASNKSSIWFSDGSSGGTYELVEFEKNALHIKHYQIAQTLFLSVAFEDHTYGLFKTDGTAENTELVFETDVLYPVHYPFIGFGERALHVRVEGNEINYYSFREDGTYDVIHNGPSYHNINSSLIIDDLVYLSIDNYLYRTDGSTNSFDPIYDYNVDGGGLYYVTNLTQRGKNLYLEAQKNNVRTPWRLPILFPSLGLEFAGAPQSSSFPVGFEQTGFNSQSEKQTIKVSNAGYTALKFTGSVTFDLAGPNHEDFELDLSGISNKINPNKSGEIGITFTPKGIGTRSATLLILTNDEENPLIEIALTGSGTKADPTISFAELPTKSILDEPFDLVASVDTDQEISFSSSNPEIASVDGATVTIHKIGEVNITASVEATDFYYGASKEQTLTIEGLSQTITFEPLPEKTFGDTPFELSATASSGLDVTFSSSDAAVASVEGVTVTILKAGSATITASQAGNDNYSSATATQTLTIDKAAQTITFGAIQAKTFGDEPFVLAASSTSGLVVAYASSDATVAKVDGTNVSLLKPGSATITASQAGSDNYLAATSVEQSLVVNKAGQTISFEPLAAKTYGDPPFELSAISSIGLPIAFSSSDPAVVSVEGNSASIVKAGAVTITASQAGNDNYNTASAEQTITVAKASQTITFDELPTLQSDDEPIELVAEASSGLPVAFQSEDETIATMEGATLTITGSGTTSITATQGGDENYLAAAEITRALVVEEVTGLGNELTAQIKVYPNPTESFIAIELSGSITEVSYTLTLTTGQKVKEGRLTSQQGKVEIPFDGMSAGTYLLTLTNGELSSTWRIIKN
ncbi:MAG: T9SS type A sorting domain-containing protein [Imperialibacter sp.]|uniref:T9SS type A sorting domain-containing protein n=1 Tax=Imperialibacter sp. TaxID=2038411 RepID=UPI0032EEA3E0